MTTDRTDASILPDFETLVVERLVLNLGEIPGIQMVYENPPSMKAGVSDVPYAFPMIGAMVGSVPATKAGRVTVVRNYPIIVAHIKVESDNDGVRGQGANGYKALRLLISPIRNYFMTHSSLETDAGDKLNKLDYISQQIGFQEQGIEQDANEGRYILRLNLTVTMSATISRLA